MRSAGVLFAALSIFGNAVATPIDDFEKAIALETRQIPSKPCSKGVHVIAVSGDGAQNQNSYGLIGSLAKSILKAIPDSTNVTLPYNKDRSGNQIQSFNQGATNLNTFISQYKSHCPNTKIVLLGYSAGAIITSNTLCGAQSPWTSPRNRISPALASPIIATVLYGDQTRHPGLPNKPGFNLGTGPNCHGRFPRQNLQNCPYNFKYQSYCDKGDPECCPGSPGQDPQVHFGYPKKYDGAATQFVVKQYNANR